MKPTVGRNVHYYSDDQSEPLHGNIIKVRVKRGLDTITDQQVQDEETYDVMVHVVSEHGQFNQPACPFSYQPLSGHWSWPPRV